MKQEKSVQQFKAGQRLTPTEVYCIGVGIFESGEYECVKIIGDVNYGTLPNPELGRIYKNTETGKHYLWAFPGKDNNEKMGPNSPEKSLSFIKNEINQAIETDENLSEVEIDKKFFPVCESNEYNMQLSNLLGSVSFHTQRQHYVLAVHDAELDAYQVIDSIRDLGYPVDGVDAALGKNHEVTYTGQQKNYTDCGHHVTENLLRELNNTGYGKELEINKEVLENHSDYYALGNEKVMEFGSAQYPAAKKKADAKESREKATKESNPQSSSWLSWLWSCLKSVCCLGNKKNINAENKIIKLDQENEEGFHLIDFEDSSTGTETTEMRDSKGHLVVMGTQVESFKADEPDGEDSVPLLQQ